MNPSLGRSQHDDIGDTGFERARRPGFSADLTEKSRSSGDLDQGIKLSEAPAENGRARQADSELDCCWNEQQCHSTRAGCGFLRLRRRRTATGSWRCREQRAGGGAARRLNSAPAQPAASNSRGQSLWMRSGGHPMGGDEGEGKIVDLPPERAWLPCQNSATGVVWQPAPTQMVD